jgi:hypothetical protein
MSASDAAPLPRLGEVFFDVRGSSRSMRLSWYADTGVAVFSIWQGGMCTGTFRLPIGDLPRMIEILQQGPEGGQPRARAGHRAEQAWGGREMAGTGQREVPPAELHYEDADIGYPDEQRTGYSHADVETSVGSYGRDELTRPREDFARPQRGTHAPDDLAGAQDRGPDFGSGTSDYGPPGTPDYGPPGTPDYGPPGTPDYGPPGAPDYGPPGAPGYGPGDYGGDRNRGYLPPGPGEQDPSGLRGDDTGYGQQRFVPPYVRGTVGEYGGDIPGRPPGRPDDPIRAAYRGDPEPGPSQPENYLRQPWPESDYSEGPRYRLADQQSAPGGSTPGRHSPGRHGNYLREPDPGDQDYEAGLPPDIDGATGDYPTWRSR